MSVPSAPNFRQQHITLLLAQPPEQSPMMLGKVIGPGTFSVEAPDLPTFPAWQTHDLILCRYFPPWIALDEQGWSPLAPAEADEQESVAIRMIRNLIDRLRQNPDVYNPLRNDFHDHWAPIMLGLFNTRTRSGLPPTDIDRVIMTSMTVFDLSMLVAPPDLSPDSPPAHARIDRDLKFAKQLISVAPEIRLKLRRCLEEIGIRPDFWSEMVLFGLLLHPHGMVWVMHPINLGALRGGTPLERGIELAIGVPDTTYRSANKVHRAFGRAWGGARQPDRPGPKPGHPRRKSEDRNKFEEYILGRQNFGLSPWLITQEAEAQRLYRKSRNDQTVSLNEQIVRRVLRNHRDSDNSV